MESSYSSVYDPWIMMITALLALLLLGVLLLLFGMGRKPKSQLKVPPPLPLPPGSYGWPFVGETGEFVHTRNTGYPEKFVRERMARYGSDVFKTSLLGKPMAVLCGAAGNKFLFSNENKSVAVWWPASVRALLGECLATTPGVEGMMMRNMVSYFVTPDAFTKLYIQTMDIVSRQHIHTYWQDKEELKVFPAVKLYTFELACRLFMSVEEAAQINKLAALFNVFLGGIISMAVDFPGTRFYKAKRATAAIKRELKMVVRQRREALAQNAALASQDLLTHLLASPDEKGNFMSEDVIVNNVLLLLFAGHDTSSSAITLLIRALAQHPQVLEKVVREQEEISASKRAGEYLQWEDIQKMKYSWNVVCETMRLWPPVIGSFREALVDINYGGYLIPKGWKLYWSAPLTQTDSSLFPDSRAFDPSRFQGAGPAPYTFVPFGGGPRMCLGKEFARLEILTFLHNIVTKFTWELLIPEEKLIYDPIPTPERGLPIRIHPRH
ncbi:hypothetical protein C2S53_020549 [Perilla frutescens var. hirtella]|uniref:Cytochrome P450 n=1 Tax=Perilla frutescens var. hirtella TaxID=608512 RepID=A0AAD4P857_PERFH|nr:hypothetical protein C2S53_020549 [Perilla frutescens var. hirtella]